VSGFGSQVAAAAAQECAKDLPELQFGLFRSGGCRRDGYEKPDQITKIIEVDLLGREVSVQTHVVVMSQRQAERGGGIAERLPEIEVK
jgi:hypothetical protein